MLQPHARKELPAELKDLVKEAAATARQLRLAVDEDSYAAAERDPAVPVFFAGSLTAPICVVGRDLGRDEVRWAQPLVGPSGRAVREGVLAAAGRKPTADDPRLEAALDHVLLTNLVPFKPVGNKAFPREARERFRPLLERLLVCHWRGSFVVTLGNDATDWFRCYTSETRFEELWAREDRYECQLTCELEARCGDGPRRKRLCICPLPHPSPANATWRAAFPRLLAARLEQAKRAR